MHFAEELADAEKLNVPKKCEPGKRGDGYGEGAGREHDFRVGSGEVSRTITAKR